MVNSLIRKTFHPLIGYEVPSAQMKFHPLIGYEKDCHVRTANVTATFVRAAVRTQTSLRSLRKLDCAAPIMSAARLSPRGHGALVTRHQQAGGAEGVLGSAHADQGR